MRILSPRKRATGFTMVELLVTIGIIALLTALAVPTMRSVIRNSHIRATSMSLQNGLALARSEAVRMNTRVNFVMNSTGWNIQLADGTLLQQASGKERTSDLNVTTTPAATTTTTFDAFGRRAAGPTQIDVTLVTSVTGMKPLRLQVLASGLARLCDPAILVSTEPKACLTTP